MSRGARLDLTLTQRGLAESRTKAQALIASGRVKVAGFTERRAERLVGAQIELSVASSTDYVSRSALKLAHGLDAFGIDVTGLACADVGSSTGGFTEVLLARGAAVVHAIDVGRNLLHWRLRQDPRVRLHEGTNARYWSSFEDDLSLCVFDVSFISLRLVIPAIMGAAPRAEAVVLFKPQFEVGRAQVGTRGVVTDPTVVQSSIDDFRQWADRSGWQVSAPEPAPIKGARGNQEYLLHLSRPER